MRTGHVQQLLGYGQPREKGGDIAERLALGIIPGAGWRAREIQAVVFFKSASNGDVRVSMRSKYDVDVRKVAGEYGGGGHKNAAGFTVAGPLDAVREGIVRRLIAGIAEGLASRP